MSIAVLLKAAEYLERREREAEHGYASSLPCPEDYDHTQTLSVRTQNKRITKAQVQVQSNKKTHGNNRTTHNELEKNRRAHLRDCMERLKAMVPLSAESSRHTTLGLLTKAKLHIKVLKERERKHVTLKEQLAREQRYLRRRLEALTGSSYRQYRVERSISECSSSTSSSSASSTNSSCSASDPSEQDEIDILGYGSDVSTDDHSSILSNSSDGMSVNTRRLTLECVL